MKCSNNKRPFKVGALFGRFWITLRDTAVKLNRDIVVLKDKCESICMT